jgi:hypothetical protein
MLLKELLERPRPASNLRLYDPFRDLDHDELVDAVVDFANANLDGQRHILFGVNAGAVEGTGVVGIKESAMAQLKKAHRLFSAGIDPALEVAFMFDKIHGKLVGALEIDGCDNGPYAIDPDFFDTLAIDQAALKESAAAKNNRADEAAEPIPVSVTFTEPPGSELLELPVPDTSNPPSAREKQPTKQGIDWKKALRDTVETVNTGIFNLTHGRQQGADARSDKSRVETLRDKLDGADKQFVDANNYYFFEEKAVKVNLTVCNKDVVGIEGATIEISLPRSEDFDVADRVYSRPDDDSPLKEADMCTYPEVRRGKGGIWVRGSLGLLVPDKPKPAFESALRLAVGPSMAGRKVGLSWAIRGQDKKVLDKGTLKIRFARDAA